MAIKALFLLILSIVSVGGFSKPGFAGAFNAYNYYPDNQDSVVGTVKEINRNSINIYVEPEHRLRRYVYLYQDPNIRLGEYVRLYYRVNDGVVVNIKKIKVLPYKKEGQNLGYVVGGSRLIQ